MRQGWQRSDAAGRAGEDRPSPGSGKVGIGLEGAHGRRMDVDLQHCAKRLKTRLSDLEKRLKGDETTCCCATAAAEVGGGCSTPARAGGADRAATRLPTLFYKGVPPAGLGMGRSSRHGEGWRAKSFTASNEG